MANLTANYRLHQWEPTDPFLRTDFNQDLAAIDTALGRAERSAAANAYNVYNLMLQNYYEGKYTGYKKALLFDGFLDGSGIAEKSSTLIRSSGVVRLNRYGQSDITIPYTSDYTSIRDGCAFQVQTPASSGRLTGWTVRTDMLYGGDPEEFTATITCTVKLNDAVAYQGQLPLRCTVAGSTQKMTLPTPLEVGTGDRLEVHLQSSTSTVRLSYTTNVKLCGVLHFTPASGTSGSLVSHDTALPARNRILAWARHSGGTVGITVLEGDVEYPMTRTGTTTTRNLQNQACTESAFALDGAPEGGVLAVRVELSLPSGENAAALYDYGVVLL